jgi:hypothetical protein
MAFDYDELNPVASSFIADYPANESTQRGEVRDSADVEHWAETTGFHRQISMVPGSDPLTNLLNGFVYTKTIGGITELFYEDDQGKIIQLTDDGSASPDKVSQAGDPMTGPLVMDVLAHLQLSNAGAQIQGRNFADDAYLELLGINASDEVEIGDALLASETRIFIDDVDGLKVKYDAADQVVWNKGHFANPPLATETYTSNDETITLGVNGSVSHGLTEMPDLLWSAHIRCSTADGDYAVGEVVRLDGAQQDGTKRGIQVSADATHFRWTCASINKMNLLQDDGNSLAITYASWKLVFRAWF